jgi:hypothetical protein
LHHDLAPPAAVAAGARVVVRLVALRVELAHQGGGALVDHRLELDVLDVREGQVEHFPGGGQERGEETVKEDRMEYSFLKISR